MRVCARARACNDHEESEPLLPAAAADGIPPTDFVCRHARVRRALKDRFSESLIRVVYPLTRSRGPGLLLRGVPRDAARAAIKYCVQNASLTGVNIFSDKIYIRDNRKKYQNQYIILFFGFGP